jgi:hypothetical protein
MNVSWTKCQGDAWCPLATVSLEHAHFDGREGVFIIWHGGTSPTTVLIGRGMIRDRLRFYRTDHAVQAFAPSGLFATWATIPTSQQEGVISYLTKRLSPKIAQHIPASTVEIPVNLPWQ